MKGPLEGKNIVLGVCGGIAAYKAIELLRLLTKEGASVRVIMTGSARKFVGEMTFSVLSGQEVLTDLFDKDDFSIRHIAWAEKADAVVIAPATANVVGKLAGGIADDVLSTFMLAVTAPILLCPSMNTHMYENRIVQRNLDLLEQMGMVLVEPGSGELACGVTGAGRLPEPAYIVDRLANLLSPKDLTGKRILVTAGPTREAIDPVRFVSNHSSGKMGYAIARAAEFRGASVTLVSGPVGLARPVGVSIVDVISTSDMADAVLSRMENFDAIIKVAAVADYGVKSCAEHKIKKSSEDFTLDLTKNIDILKEAGKRKNGQVLIGFAAETQDLRENAAKKLIAKNLDMIVGNLVGSPESGFGTDTNIVTLFKKDGSSNSLPSMDKLDVAHEILNSAIELMGD